MTTKHPPLNAVKSSNISAIGHDPQTSDMHVLFKNGGHYVYHGVDAVLHGRVVSAPSVGTALTGLVKGKFKHTKVSA